MFTTIASGGVRAAAKYTSNWNGAVGAWKKLDNAENKDQVAIKFEDSAPNQICGFIQQRSKSTQNSGKSK